MSRTNESYSRWLEARKAWSGILVRTRDLVRMVSTLPSSAVEHVTQAEFALLTLHVDADTRCLSRVATLKSAALVETS